MKKRETRIVVFRYKGREKLFSLGTKGKMRSIRFNLQQSRYRSNLRKVS